MKRDQLMNYARMPKNSYNALMAAARSVEEEKPVKKKNLVLILALATLTVSLACTALAVGLSQLARYSAVKSARQTVAEKYGISMDAFGLFQVEATEGERMWRVVFQPHGIDTEAIGEYTVTIADGQAPEAIWTHDGIDLSALDTATLASPVWGAKQLDVALALQRARQTTLFSRDWGNYGNWTLEEQAAMDQALLDAGGGDINGMTIHVLPAAEDLQQADALAMAKKAIVDKYGISTEMLDRQLVQVEFVQKQPGAEKQYNMTFVTPTGEPNSYQVHFFVDISSPSGEVVRCKWWVDPQERTLPEGSLAGYRDAVQEFVEEGAFDVLAPEKKAEIGARIIEAGFGEVIENQQYQVPLATDMTQEAAIVAAEKALCDEYEFTDKTLAMFKPTASLLLVEGKRVWEIEYAPVIDMLRLVGPISEKLGNYHVEIAADSGAIVRTSWSGAAEHSDAVYTRKTWGQAPKWDAKTLLWLQELLDARAPLLAKYSEEDDYWDWSMEDIAAHDQMFRDAGFDANEFRCGMPDEGDMSRDTALKLAKQALHDEYGIAIEELDTYYLTSDFWVNEPGRHVWAFGMQNGEKDFGISIDAKTGEVLYTGLITGGNG